MPFGRTDDSAFLSRGQDGVKDQLHVLHILMAVIPIFSVPTPSGLSSPVNISAKS